MVSAPLRKRLNAGVVALLLSALVLSACKQAATATATPTKLAPAATATKGEDVAPSDTETSPPPAPTEDNSILFEDDFSDTASGWPTVQTAGGVAGYQDGGLYRLDVSAPLVVLIAPRPGAFSDFSLETTVSALAASGQFRYGVAFRQLTPDNYYAAFVNPANQTFLVAKRLLGEFTTLASGQNAAIPTSGPATLRIDAHGADITFSVNGVGLVTLSDTSFAAGDVGYVLETHDDAASARLDADSIVIRRFNADTVPDAPPAGAVLPTDTPAPDPNATATPVPPTVRPVGTVPQPPATQALPSTQALQATAGALGTNVAATANAAATQACALLTCP